MIYGRAGEADRAGIERGDFIPRATGSGCWRILRRGVIR